MIWFSLSATCGLQNSNGTRFNIVRTTTYTALGKGLLIFILVKTKNKNIFLFSRWIKLSEFYLFIYFNRMKLI